MVLYIMSKNFFNEPFCITTWHPLHIRILNLDWAFTEAVGGLVSSVEALLGSNAAPTAVRIETKLEAARRVNAILAKVLIVPCGAILPNILCTTPGKTEEGSPRGGYLCCHERNYSRNWIGERNNLKIYSMREINLEIESKISNQVKDESIFLLRMDATHVTSSSLAFLSAAG